MPKRRSDGYYVLLGSWRLLWVVFAVIVLFGVPMLATRLFPDFVQLLNSLLGVWFYLVVTPFVLAWAILLVLYIFLPIVLKFVWPVETWFEKWFND